MPKPNDKRVGVSIEFCLKEAYHDLHEAHDLMEIRGDKKGVGMVGASMLIVAAAIERSKDKAAKGKIICIRARGCRGIPRRPKA